MEITQIKYILELARCNSFTKAAHNLSVTQPAVSHQLLLAEEELGVKLFNRNTHGVTLTSDGEKFCDIASNIIKYHNELMVAFSGSDQSEIKIGLYMFYKVGNASQIIIDYISENHVPVSISSVSTTEAFSLLHDGTLDFAIVKIWENTIPHYISYYNLYSEPLTVLMRRDNPYADREYIQREDLSNFTFLLDARDPSIFKHFSDMCLQNDIVISPAKLNTNGADMEIEAIKANVGVGLFTEKSGTYFNGDEMVAVPIEPPIYMTTCLLYSRDRSLTQYETEFLNHIIEHGSEI